MLSLTINTVVTDIVFRISNFGVPMPLSTKQIYLWKGVPWFTGRFAGFLGWVIVLMRLMRFM